MTHDSERHAGISRGPILAVTALLATMAAATLLLPTLREIVVRFVGLAQESVLSTCHGILPEPLQPNCQKGVDTYLSPWLYLLVAMIFAAEKWIPADRRQPVLSKGLAQDAVAWFALNMVPRAIALAFIVASTDWVYRHYLTFATIDATLQWSDSARVVAALILTDFLAWFHHYVRHKVPLFWIFHAVHHSQTQMNLFTDLRVHFVEYLIAMPISLVPLFMMNLNVEFAFWIVLLRGSFTRFYHANLRTSLGPLRYLLVTPQSHRIHHSREPRHQDKNFGVIFSIWDRIFGTQWSDCEEYPPTGVADPDFPLEERVGSLWTLVNYVQQVVYPFKQALVMIGGRKK